MAITIGIARSAEFQVYVINIILRQSFSFMTSNEQEALRASADEMGQKLRVDQPAPGSLFTRVYSGGRRRKFAYHSILTLLVYFYTL